MAHTVVDDGLFVVRTEDLKASLDIAVIASRLLCEVDGSSHDEELRAWALVEGDRIGLR